MARPNTTSAPTLARPRRIQSAWRSRTVLLGDNAEHDLASLSRRGKALEGGARLREREDGVDLRPHLARIDEPGDLDELPAISLDDEVDGVDRFGRLGGNRDDASAVAKQRGR